MIVVPVDALVPVVTRRVPPKLSHFEFVLQTHVAPVPAAAPTAHEAVTIPNVCPYKYVAVVEEFPIRVVPLPNPVEPYPITISLLTAVGVNPTPLARAL